MRQSNVHKPDDQLPYVGIGVRPIHIAKFVFSTMVLSLFRRGLLEIIIIDLLTSNWLFIIALPVSLLTFLWCYFSNMDAFEKLHHKKESQDTVPRFCSIAFYSSSSHITTVLRSYALLAIYYCAFEYHGFEGRLQMPDSSMQLCA